MYSVFPMLHVGLETYPDNLGSEAFVFEFTTSYCATSNGDRIAIQVSVPWLLLPKQRPFLL